MAPPSRTAKPPKSILKPSSSTTPAKAESLFASSKKDKRRIKHAHLMNKVAKSSTKPARRRRPNKKLITTLEALADALPSEEDGNESSVRRAAGQNPEDQVNIIKRKSLKSRPGAMKRREKVDRGERDRFAKNMAQLAASRPTAQAGTESVNGSVKADGKAAIPSTSDRWAALRGFISQTLETKPELKNIKT